MSYCYVDDDTTSDQSSPSNHHYHHLMPESPLQPKLSANHSPTTNNHINRVGSNMSPNSQLEHEKRVRREIANSNERRRMQSINTGFQSLKILIPHSCGEKLSKACILQRAADHIKALENEKIKLQSQNEQFRILIKSFQIDSTSVLQSQRLLSTNDHDETVLLVNNDTKTVDHVEIEDDQLRLYHGMKSRHIIPSWQSADNVARYQATAKDEIQETSINASFYPCSSSASSTSVHRTNPNSKPKGSPTPLDTGYILVKPQQPSQRCYKTSSLDQTNENATSISLERCHLRAQSVDTNNNTNPSSISSNPLNHPVSRRSLQTIVEAIRHVEGDEALSNISSQATSCPLSTQQEDLPAQIKAMIHEKFQQQNKISANNSFFQQTINVYEQTSTTAAITVPSLNIPSSSTATTTITTTATAAVAAATASTVTATSSTTHDVDLHQKPPKKRKITYNENDDLVESATTAPQQSLFH